MKVDASFHSSKSDLIKRVLPALERIEQQRLEHLAEYKKRRTPFYLMCAGIAVAALGVAFLLNAVAGGFAAIFLGYMAWQWANEPAKQYRRTYKQSLLPQIANGLGEFTYCVNSGIAMSTLEPSGIIPNHHRYNHEDHFEGTYAGVRMEFCESKLQVRRRSRRRTYYQTVFNGLVVRLDMHKPFNGRTVVRRDAGMFNWMKSFGPLERIKLEDPEFEKLYEVHGNDQVEARMLLTPAFMERLKGLERAVGAKSLECASYQNRLLIMMPHDRAMLSDGLMEPGPIHQPAQNHDVVEKIADEFSSICSIVDELKISEQKRPTPAPGAPSA